MNKKPKHPLKICYETNHHEMNNLLNRHECCLMDYSSSLLFLPPQSFASSIQFRSKKLLLPKDSEHLVLPNHLVLPKDFSP